MIANLKRKIARSRPIMWLATIGYEHYCRAAQEALAAIFEEHDQKQREEYERQWTRFAEIVDGQA